MSTVKQSNGNQLRQTINRITGSQAEQAKEKCIEAVEKYASKLKEKYSGMSLERELYDFYNRMSGFSDGVYEYYHNSLALITALATPSVNELLKNELGESSLKEITAMLWELHILSNSLKEDIYLERFSFIELNNYTRAEDKTPEMWREIELKYTRLYHAELVKTGEVEIK